MIFCKHCMVSYENPVTRCVLCSRLVETVHDELVHELPDDWFPARKDEVVSKPQQMVRKRGLWLLIAAVCAGIPAGVSILLEYLISATMTWSLIVVASLFMLFTAYVFILIFYKRIFRMLGLLCVNFMIFLFFLASIIGSAAWVYAIAWPICISATVLTMLVIKGIRVFRRKQHFTAALILLSIALLTMVIDFAIQLHVFKLARLFWSTVVLAACVPVASLLALIGVAYHRSSSLRRILHW